MKLTTNYKKSALWLALFASSSQAGETINLGNDATLDWKGTITYSAGMRLEEPDPVLAATSSGDRNFDQYDMIGNGLYLLLEGHLRWDNFGFVASASTFYDHVYQDDKFSDDAQKYSGGYTRLLDFYGYTAFPFGEYGYADIRVGRHVVAWGEGLFFPSISLAQGPTDAIKASVPGTEVKEILLPEDQISLQLEVTPELSLLAQWQFNWQETLVPEPGTFFSTSEAVGEGATCLTQPPGEPCIVASRGPNIEPGKTDQWGIGTRYRLTEVSELGLYYLNYSDRIPMVNLDLSNMFIGELPEYNVVYFDDIKLYGLTYSTNVGIASIAAEVSYKDGAPVLVGAALPSRGEILQTNLNTIINFGRNAIAESVNLTAEIAYVDILDAEKRNMTGIPSGMGISNPETDELYYDDHSLAAAATLILSYPSFTEGWGLSIPIGYTGQISGRTITGGVGGEGDHRARIGAELTHNETNILLALQYSGYFGDPDVDDPIKQRPLSDRDNISFSAKYAF
ncbi:DUF1302 domain-containing protein [Vibrio alfacsensis]|uniref:DUF1302 domain-containing protein n=1 Tax=Vibrio alfacsensis TaxID=1074311 RepID=UPI0040691691